MKPQSYKKMSDVFITLTRHAVRGDLQVHEIIKSPGYRLYFDRGVGPLCHHQSPLSKLHRLALDPFGKSTNPHPHFGYTRCRSCPSVMAH